MSDAPLPDTREFELFKLAVELADRNTARRAGANTFFVSLHSIIATLVGYFALRTADQHLDKFSEVVIAFIGSVLSFTWWAMLRYYRRLSKAKWDVINDMEASLPAKPFTAEWTKLHPNSGGSGWIPKYKHR